MKVRPQSYKKYPIEQIHELFRSWEKYGSSSYRHKKRIYEEFDGFKVKTWSQRYDLFLQNTTCVACGLKANCYILERENASDTWHFNLYHVSEDGKETLFTKDHIIPASKGGRNVLSNYQTMCERCNTKKADSL